MKALVIYTTGTCIREEEERTQKEEHYMAYLLRVLCEWKGARLVVGVEVEKVNSRLAHHS